MNYNTPNETSLLDLIGALKGGLDPSTAYGVYQNIQQDQAQQIANRQQRLGGLSELLSGAAMQGMPYSGANALAEAQPGPAGPAVQAMLQSLYPGGSMDTPVPPTNASGATMDFPTGSRATIPSDASFGNAGAGGAPNPYAGVAPTGPNVQSPTFQPVAPSPTEQLAMDAQARAGAMQQALQQFAVDASAKAQGGMDMQTFLVQAAPVYPDLFSTPEGIKQVQQIALTVFPQQATA